MIATRADAVRAPHVSYAADCAPFSDRSHAGDALTRLLTEFSGHADAIVVGLARGGIPVAARIAMHLDLPLHAFVVRKIGVPGVEQVALGAISEGTDRVTVDSIAQYVGVPSRIIQRLAARERVALERETKMYRAQQPMPLLTGRTVILVDDGIATGATMRAAVHAMRDRQVAHIVVAAPVASLDAFRALEREADSLVVTEIVSDFTTVSAFYEDFSPVTDCELYDQLGYDGLGSRLADQSSELAIRIPVLGGTIDADLGMPAPFANEASSTQPSTSPAGARGLIVLVHAGGSSRDNYRMRYVAGRLRLAGYATLRLDLLTADEQEEDKRTASLRFNLSRITSRLVNVCEWVTREHVPGAQRIVAVGASTGAASIIRAASQRRTCIAGVVSLSGCADIALHALPEVKVPSLFVVAAADRKMLKRNQIAQRALTVRSRLVRIPRAGRAFDEPGAIGLVAEHIVRWLETLESPHGSRGVFAEWIEARINAVQSFSATITSTSKRYMYWP